MQLQRPPRVCAPAARPHRRVRPSATSASTGSCRQRPRPHKLIPFGIRRPLVQVELDGFAGTANVVACAVSFKTGPAAGAWLWQERPLLKFR
jgi:hypothetical protein